MFRPRLLLTSLAIALGACSPQDPQAVTSAALAQQVILPTYSRWVEADQALASSALAYCQGKEDLAKARDAFHAAQKAWAELQPLLIGPLAEGNRAWQVQFWPDKKDLVGRQVEQLLKNNPQVDAAALAKASVVVQGSPPTNTSSSTARSTSPTPPPRPAIARCWKPSAPTSSNWPRTSWRAGRTTAACSPR